MGEAAVRVLVVGSGVMGCGIAVSFARAGIATAILSRNAEAVSGLEGGIGVFGELPEAPPDLIIESIPERAELKIELYRRIEARYGGAAVLASNTSGLSLQELARGLGHPEQFCGIHYFQPADVAPVVEVARIAETTAPALATARGLVEASGKMVVVLAEPIPGLLINRLQHAMLNEAYRLIESGIVTAAEVDLAAKHLLGPRMSVTGLIEQKDLSGLDTHALAQAAIVPQLHHEAEPSPVITGKLARGELGIKTGTGFYDWRQADVEAHKAWASELLGQVLGLLEQSRRPAPPLAGGDAS